MLERRVREGGEEERVKGGKEIGEKVCVRDRGGEWIRGE